MTKKIFSVCVSHAPPLVPASLYDEVLSLGDYGVGDNFHVSNLEPFWHQHRELSYGAAGSYSIPAGVFKNKINANTLIVSGYRKIVLNRLVGREAENYPGMRLVDAGSSEVFHASDALPLLDSDFLLSAPLEFKQGLYKQYDSAHKAVDFLDYLTLVVKMGVLSEDEALEFLDMKWLIPGGCEMGAYPFDWCLEKLAIIEKVGREFIATYEDRISSYDAYQVRAVGFLSERLGSYFLIRELSKRYPTGVPAHVFGHLTSFVLAGEGYAIGKT